MSYKRIKEGWTATLLKLQR